MKRILNKLFIISCIIVAWTMSFKAYSQQSENPPVIPMGLDTYRMWDKLPVQRINNNTYPPEIINKQSIILN